MVYDWIVSTVPHDVKAPQAVYSDVSNPDSGAVISPDFSVCHAIISALVSALYRRLSYA
jgi:hypothetical protein